MLQNTSRIKEILLKSKKSELLLLSFVVLKQIKTGNIHGKAFRELWQMDGMIPKNGRLNQHKSGWFFFFVGYFWGGGLSVVALYTIER
jgi:hypothetical protein